MAADQYKDSHWLKGSEIEKMSDVTDCNKENTGKV